VAATGNGAFQLVIFDNDGVVVDSEPLSSGAMSATLTSLGFPLSAARCDQWFKGGTLERTRALVEGRFGRKLPGDFEAIYTEALFESLASDLRPVAGVEAVLDRLDAVGARYCLASSGRRLRVQFALQAAGVAARFGDRWWGAEDVAVGKPAPDLFLLAAKSMGADAGQCAVVEDSDLGIQAAKAAGMVALGFAARTPAVRLAGADAIFTDMVELPALLGVG
jgi:HAD superfamily hydrolase (TIGR01509 family)